MAPRFPALAGMVGLEPTNAGVKVPCLTTWLHPNRTSGKGRSGRSGPQPRYGVGNGARTHDTRNHNPVLCQLSYTHRIDLSEFPGERPVPAEGRMARRRQSGRAADDGRTRGLKQMETGVGTPEAGAQANVPGARWADPGPFRVGASRRRWPDAQPCRWGQGLARLKGLEPLTHCLEGSCSIHLSYRRVWSG